ncbi:MAG: CYTH domain-containing protein [Proteobacteria bacterium]|nr:CYTH domain-containing protein [Pseudomonadota bacterium]
MFCDADTAERTARARTVEIERKFLVDTAKWRPADAGVDYRQGYLVAARDRSVRVRVAGRRGYLTIKGATVGATRSEFEYEIPLDHALSMLDGLCERPIIEKTRHTERIAGRDWEIDVFHGQNEGLVVAEIELDTETDTFEKPAWAGREVSDDPRYLNANLFRHPFGSWPPAER